MALSLVSYLPNLVQNDFWVRKKFMDMKKFWVENDFEVTKNLGEKKLGVQNIVKPMKDFGLKKIWDKNCWSNFHIGQKKN